MNIPLLDLKAQLDPIRDEIMEAVTATVDSTCYIMGPQIELFEKNIADYCGTKTAVGVSSGTDALLASLMALGVRRDDLVLTTPYTFFATMGSILRLGAQPVFADIDPVSPAFRFFPGVQAEGDHAGASLRPMRGYGTDLENGRRIKHSRGGRCGPGHRFRLSHGGGWGTAVAKGRQHGYLRLLLLFPQQESGRYGGRRHGGDQW